MPHFQTLHHLPQGYVVINVKISWLDRPPLSYCVCVSVCVQQRFETCSSTHCELISVINDYQQFDKKRAALYH